MRTPTLLAALSFFTAPFALSACDGEDEVVDPGFTADVAGAVTLTASGEAGFGVMHDNGVTGFTIVMEDEASGLTILLQRPGTSRSTPGSYPIVPAGAVGPNEYRGEVLYIDGALHMFEVQQGLLVITESAPNFIRGSMTLEAVRTSPCCDPEPVTIDVEGTFTAAHEPVAALR